MDRDTEDKRIRLCCEPMLISRTSLFAIICDRQPFSLSPFLWRPSRMLLFSRSHLLFRTTKVLVAASRLPFPIPLKCSTLVRGFHLNICWHQADVEAKTRPSISPTMRILSSRPARTPHAPSSLAQQQTSAQLYGPSL